MVLSFDRQLTYHCLLHLFLVCAQPTKAEMKELFYNYPKKFKASTQHAESYYVLQKDLYAVHGEVPAVCKAAIIASIEDGKIVVCKGNPNELPPSVDHSTLTPVYTLGGNGLLAVPTGLILIRYTDNIVAISRKQAIQSIGYIIDQPLAYAPQAAWLKAANGAAWILFLLNLTACLSTNLNNLDIRRMLICEDFTKHL